MVLLGGSIHSIEFEIVFRSPDHELQLVWRYNAPPSMPPLKFEDAMIESPSADYRHSIRDELVGVIAFIGVIWLTFVLDLFLPLEQFALVPRTIRGLPGIVAMPFLHGGWGHLISNTTPLFVLLILLAGSRARSWLVVTAIVLLGDVLLWIFGRNGNAEVVQVHVGASGLVFGLITFLLAAGFLERRVIPLLTSLLVGFLYGGTLLFGVLPLQRGISWDGHLWGAVAGILVAFSSARVRSAVSSERNGL